MEGGGLNPIHSDFIDSDSHFLNTIFTPVCDIPNHLQRTRYRENSENYSELNWKGPICRVLYIFHYYFRRKANKQSKVKTREMIGHRMPGSFFFLQNQTVYYLGRILQRILAYFTFHTSKNPNCLSVVVVFFKQPMLIEYKDVKFFTYFFFF